MHLDLPTPMKPTCLPNLSSLSKPAVHLTCCRLDFARPSRHVCALPDRRACAFAAPAASEAEALSTDAPEILRGARARDRRRVRQTHGPDRLSRFVRSTSGRRERTRWPVGEDAGPDGERTLDLEPMVFGGMVRMLRKEFKTEGSGISHQSRSVERLG